MQKSVKNIIVGLLVILVSLVAIQIVSFYTVYTAKDVGITHIEKDILMLVARVIVEIFLIAFLLYLGFWIANRKQTYILVTNTVILSYGIFVMQFLAEIVWLMFTKNNYSLFEINNFSSLSLLSITGVEKTPLYLIYPLSAANVWELLFVVILTVLLVKRTKLPFKKVSVVALCAYLLPFICWVGFVCYVNMVNTL
jgi:hypothetical protein